jgi:CheY-like chemotaxis protein
MADDKLHILLVDDNPDDVEIITRQLEREFPGVEIEQASGPEQFDRALEAGRFNLVITDFQLQWGENDVYNCAFDAAANRCKCCFMTANVNGCASRR